MQSRLAFAICTQVNADILIVDEALAVGDIGFAQKCLDYIRDFARRGTILMVSHSPGALQMFCDRIIWIEDGLVREEGAPAKVLAHYGQGLETAEDISPTAVPVPPADLRQRSLSLLRQGKWVVHWGRRIQRRSCRFAVLQRFAIDPGRGLIIAVNLALKALRRVA